MILFFEDSQNQIFAVKTSKSLQTPELLKLQWLFGDAERLSDEILIGPYIGPRAAMVTPWSTNAVEITINMGIEGIERIENFHPANEINLAYDPMLQHLYPQLNQHIFEQSIQVEPIQYIDDIAGYNLKEGLALSKEEVEYLEELSSKLGRKLTDSEVFGFSQVNSEHCRHKIFNGVFILDGVEKDKSLFKLIRETSSENPNYIVSAYRDNVAFVEGSEMTQFAPKSSEKPEEYIESTCQSVLSLKAETHNFPTTVEAFNGAATGSGGEIRDRLAGGTGSVPLAGTAVYMTAYPRMQEGRSWEENIPGRKWLYQSPKDILIKASNGASDFGNKFGQPLISGAVLTFENEENHETLGYDKVIMLAGGVGYGKAEYAEKKLPKKGDKIVLLGGDNYRIGMGGAAVSSADTGTAESSIELNAIQRSNPEMQKRVANAIRAMVESNENPVISIHDHGAGGHLNCLSELVEHTGGTVWIDQLPIGDPSLSLKEIIGNESQERMGLIIAEKDLPALSAIAERERAPMYVIGEVTKDHHFSFVDRRTGNKPIDLALSDFFGSAPKTIMQDKAKKAQYQEPEYSQDRLDFYLESVLQLEAVACKDWLTNKVDRCVGGKVAVQQCSGVHQLPLNNCGVMALDHRSHKGVATSIGQAPISALADAAAGSRLAIAEALTNLLWAPLEHGLKGVSLSANWMWPCRNAGEDVRLYEAVEACSRFAIELGINIPTGKDSLSMTQKYPDGQEVKAPGTVIISSVGLCSDIRKVVEPPVQLIEQKIYYIDLSGCEFKLGGSSLAQVLNRVGQDTPDVKSASYFKNGFEIIQKLIKNNLIAAGHDVSSGGLIVALLEMCFSTNGLGMDVCLPNEWGEDLVKILFAENPSVIIQADAKIEEELSKNKISYECIATVNDSGKINLHCQSQNHLWDVSEMRKLWYKTSYLFDIHQSGESKATERYMHHADFPLSYLFPASFTGKLPERPAHRPKAAVIREKGSNSEREMALALYLAGFDVRDVHMTDLVSGRENLEDIQFIGAVGGFSNSDVLGSAKGWAGAFKYNPEAADVLRNFFNRPDTLSVGICNGCQLFMELGLIYPDREQMPYMAHNDTYKHESNFLNVVIQPNESVMLKSLSGTQLGIWISHGEGKFVLPEDEKMYKIAGKYIDHRLPANPNGSDYNAAMLYSEDGRHLVTMPHFERSIFPWNWALYPHERRSDMVSPWLEAFVNARNWLLKV
jgi:phosphoribosylformylglycinamidine synthase